MNPQRQILTDGAVVVSGNRIIALGNSDSILPRCPYNQVYDCTNHILLPGLIDTHVHTAQAMIRGCADDLSLLDWLGKRVWVLQGNYTAEDGKASAALCIIERAPQVALRAGLKLGPRWPVEYNEERIFKIHSHKGCRMYRFSFFDTIRQQVQCII